MSAAVSNLIGMTDEDRELLDFEDQSWRSAAAKEVQVHERFGLSATRYYQRLNHVIDTPDALAYKPLLVKRLQRMRDARRRQRNAVARSFEA